jgi:predicted CopG family antitoxin
MNEGELTRRLVRMKERYSEPFADLIQKMVKKDPYERIDFAELIDELNPLLQSNLEAIKRVHSLDSRDEQEQTQLEETYEYGGGVDDEQLRSRLITM